MLEIVRAFNWIIDQGKAFYWATSEWSAEEIEEAHREFILYSLFSFSKAFMLIRDVLTLANGNVEIAEKYLLHAPVSL